MFANKFCLVDLNIQPLLYYFEPTKHIFGNMNNVFTHSDLHLMHFRTELYWRISLLKKRIWVSKGN